MAFAGAGALETLYRSSVDDASIVFFALRRDGTIVAANPAASAFLGEADASRFVGGNILDRLHPDEVERAVYQMQWDDGRGTQPGVTKFRFRHADGSWRPIEIWASTVTDGAEALIGVYGRSGVHQVFLEDLLASLLSGVPRTEALAPVCNVVQWHEVGSHVVIGWCDARGSHQVTTGLLGTLGWYDFDADAAQHGSDPWRVCSTGATTVTGTAEELDEERRALAAESEVMAFWIEPVLWSEIYPAATVTVWTAVGGRPPQTHAYGMGLARRMAELVLRWTEKVDALDQAARIDPLTEVANRRTFLTALASATRGGGVLYCDLDRFKPVNDRFGHRAGDQVLRLVARRLEASVRHTDLVARIGGDEFAVLCEGATREESAEVAARIETSLGQPFDVDGIPLTIGISVGVAFDANEINEALLDQADRSLTDAKARGRRSARPVSEHPAVP